MKSIISIILITIFVIAGLMFQSTYNLDDNNHAVITQFGKPIRVVENAGWHFKIPFIQQVHYESNTKVLKNNSSQPLTKDTTDVQSKNQNELHKAQPRKIVQIKPVDTSELNCPTQIVDGIEQVILQPGMSNMQYNLCNEKIRRTAKH